MIKIIENVKHPSTALHSSFVEVDVGILIW